MRLVVPAGLARPLDRIRRRARQYIVACTALEVVPGRVAILADHRLLPLSWTRDAYYQALLLLHAGDAAARAAGADIVASHLRWLFLDCVRPAGAWARSHHADGRRKDERFQADQQLYPLLELCDYVAAAGRPPALGDLGVSWSRLVTDVLAALDRSAGPDGLLASEENAADDELSLPYVLSTQLLAWFTLHRLAGNAGLFEPAAAARLAARAEEFRRAIGRHFVIELRGRSLWAYAADSAGRTLLYHDANDLPTALAPLWGFLPAGDRTWQATMDFAFSPDNEGWAAGPYGGLGSHHTAGSWSLGLAQEWVARSLAGDSAGAVAALDRLCAVALDDWSLPEASDPANGRLAARPWFAWPGALVGALMALDETDRWRRWAVG